MAAVLPRLLAALAPVEARPPRRPRDGARRARGRRGPDDRGDRTTTARAKCALDIALHDLVGKRLGIPVQELLGVTGEMPPTDFTLGIDAPEVVAERARRAAAFPALKIKVGGPSRPRDAARRSAAVFDGPLRVDANTGWTPDDAPATWCPRWSTSASSSSSSRSRPAATTGCATSRQMSPLPIVADESAVTIEDLDALEGVVAGVNVKLAKCGGVGPAKRMLERARERGFKTFLGCMEETSVGDRRLGGRRAAGRLGRPRRQPAGRRRPVRRPGDRRGQALAPGRTRPGWG